MLRLVKAKRLREKECQWFFCLTTYFLEKIVNNEKNYKYFQNMLPFYFIQVILILG